MDNGIIIFLFFVKIGFEKLFVGIYFFKIRCVLDFEVLNEFKLVWWGYVMFILFFVIEGCFYFFVLCWIKNGV